MKLSLPDPPPRRDEDAEAGVKEVAASAPRSVTDPLDSLTRAAIDALPRVAPFRPRSEQPARETPTDETQPSTEDAPAPRLGARVVAGAAALGTGVFALLVAVRAGQFGLHHEQSRKGAADVSASASTSTPTADLGDLFDAPDLTGGTGIFE